MPQPEHIVLIRSGRHLQVAREVLEQRFPRCRVTVIATPNTDAARLQAGIGESDWLIYDAHPQFDAWPMLAGGLAARVWARRCDRVAVLWQDPTGSDRANVDRAATVLSPGGFIAITPDGQLIERRTLELLLREAGQTIQSIATGTVLAVALYLPALVVGAVNRRRAREAR